MRISTDLAGCSPRRWWRCAWAWRWCSRRCLAFGGVPARFRVILVLALAALLVAATGTRAAGDVHDVAAFAGMAAAEDVLGALLAFGVLAAFAAFQLAGRLLDLQLGFGVATLIDPATRGHAPLLGTLLWMAGVALFFAVDGHHALLGAFALSLHAAPPGRPLGELGSLPVAGAVRPHVQLRARPRRAGR
jgi:flagellar biosynthetic protein FliR